MLDRAKSTAIRKGLNLMLKGRYGEIQSLALNTKEQRVELRILLNGETVAVELTVGRYVIDDSDPERPVVFLEEITASRQWIQELATDNIEGKTIDIPPRYAPVLKMVL